MAIGEFIQRHPLLRLLVFYACGIGVADMLYAYVSLWLLWGGGALCLLLVSLAVWRWLRKALYGVLISALMFVLGVGSYSLARSSGTYEWPLDTAWYEARVLETPRDCQHSILCEMEVVAVREAVAWHRVGRKVFVYVEPCDEVRGLRPGDVICFESNVRAPRNFSDSLSFDYARYVTMQGVAGTVFLPRGKWHRVGEVRLSLRERMLRWRAHLCERFLAKTFEGDVFGILAAITLGDRQGLSEGVRTTYSDAGAAHVLALSGLHVGIICGMLTFFLRAVLRRRCLRWLREVITIAVLWSFALLVGMPASVVRAVTMCSLYIVSRWMADGSVSSLHVLSLAAFIMLLVRPLYLFDVGFQLSFTAMAAILWLEPYLECFFLRRRRHPLFAYFVGLACMSLAAQLGTFPLVLYHFGTFPTYFLVTNIVVVPCLCGVLLLSLAWWVVLGIGLPWARPLGELLQILVEWINGMLTCVGQWPCAVLRVAGYDALAVLCTYLFIFFAGVYVTRKHPRSAVWALASLLGLLLALLF